MTKKKKKRHWFESPHYTSLDTTEMKRGRSLFSFACWKTVTTHFGSHAAT